MNALKLKIQNKSGFTLIDVLIGLFMLVFGILAWGAFIGGAVDRNASNEWKSIAVTLAEENIEALKTKAKNTIINDSDDGTSTVTVSGVSFTVTTDVINGAAGNLTDISVIVTWADNLSSTYSLTTRVHQN